MSDLCVCVHKHARLGGMGACSPRKIRCSEIVSEAILEQKQSHISYTACRLSISSNFWLSMHAFPKAADFKFPQEKVYTKFGRTAGEVTLLEGQLLSAA